MEPDLMTFFTEFASIKSKLPISEFETFFCRFDELTTNKLKGLDQFFASFAPIAQRIHSDRKSQAPRFNIFGALQIHEDEVLASRFLAYLLDPRGHHDQGIIFLSSFVKFVLDEEKTEHIVQRARVTPERWAGIFGRLDIAIEFPDGQIIIVENKINAEERPQQVEDYQTWLSLQRGDGHAVVFLTPDGRQSATARSDGIRVITLSYPSLVEWLLSISVPDRMSFVIRQFCDNFV